jgi:uncharacterized protein (TIGR02145 family)
MRKKKNFSSLVVILILVMVGVIATVSCERPTSADYDNPFDEKNPDFSPISSLTTIQVTQIGALQAVSGGEFSGISGYPITQKGVCWDTNEQPDLDNKCTTEGPGDTGFISHLTDLRPDTRYFVRAYATNVQATIFGEQREFRTGKGPQFEALTPSNVQAHSVQLNGQQTGDGFTTIQEVGFCVSVFGQPESEQCLAVSAPKMVSVLDLLSGNLGSGGLAQRSNMIAKMPLGSGNTADSNHEYTPTNQISDNLTSPSGSGNNVVNPIPDNRATTTVQTALSSGETQLFSLTITDLQADVRYLFRSYGMAGSVPFSSASRDVTTRDGSITLTTLDVIDISSTTATTGGEITDDGGSPVTARGVVWGTSENPTLESNLGQTSNGTGTGSFTSNLTGLTPGVTYYVRAYATNSVRTSFGNQISYSTATSLPQVSTEAAHSITSRSAVVGGSITNNGGGTIIDKGIVWDFQENPLVGVAQGQVSLGVGIEPYEITMDNLTRATTYYARAYAINSVGIGYGQQLTIRTPAELPVVTTTSVTISDYRATGGGYVLDDGGALVTNRGIVWSINDDPTIESNLGITTDGGGTGSFVSDLINLETETRYFIKAYATNSVGTAYGNLLVFTTPILNSDIDGNIYSTVEIGNQVWMAENLRVTRYRDGTAIPNVIENTDWANLTIGARSVYNDNIANDVIYGQLYNWYAVNDSRGLCPVGWHVPTDEEWTQLSNFLGINAGGKMKATGIQYWLSPNDGATNESGFTGLPGGFRFLDGRFFSVGSDGYWWSSTEDNNSQNPWFRNLVFDFMGLNRLNDSKRNGFSVRCVRD